MYSVLILSQKSMESFQQFYPIFSEAVEKEKIGVCQWIEAGRNVETAVPELYDKISQKRAWRAVVVSIEQEQTDDLYPTAPGNPFDFKQNAGQTALKIENGRLVESEIPLIRLSQMLGGIPAPEPQFEAVVVREEGRAPVLEYHPVRDAETLARKRAYDQWCEANTFQGQPPSEIVLLKIRRAVTSFDALAAVKDSWKLRMESDSSKFWQRNKYPHNCRFLFYDMNRRGSVGQIQDLFRLWTALLLIAENDIDPNVLQAHRLYGLYIDLDDKELTDSFQQIINKLNMAKYQLEKRMAAKNVYDDDGKIPDYTVGLPVSFQLPKASGIRFTDSDFGLAGGIGSGDMGAWENYTAHARSQLAELLQSTDRTLDQAAERLRLQCSYDAYEVRPLSRYQEVDFKDSLHEVYKDVLREQEALPQSPSAYQSDFRDYGEDVRKKIIQRMNIRQILFAVVSAVAMMLLSLLPGVIDGQSRYAAIGTGLACALILGATVMIVLTLQRRRLLRAVRQFQSQFQQVISELSRNATAYSNFLSSIASHIRGCSYLGIMKKMQQKKDSSYYFAQKHLKAIDAFMVKLAHWSAAMHLSVDMHSVDIQELMDDKVDEIDYDGLYSFDAGKNYPVPLNRVGININSPFRFIRRLYIEREEVYDDA